MSPVKQQERPLYHYVIVRADLPKGVMVAQTIHAAGESAVVPVPDGTYAVALEVPDEVSLLRLADRLDGADINYRLIVENDGPFAHQAMAIGIVPRRDRETLRPFTGELPLVK